MRINQVHDAEPNPTVEVHAMVRSLRGRSHLRSWRWLIGGFVSVAPRWVDLIVCGWAVW